jgi:alkylation response protein AidB-like acyl-CoA dehydrogenase
MESDTRARLGGWEAERPTNFFDATPNLARALRTHRGDDDLAPFESRLREFGWTVAHSSRMQVRLGRHARSHAHRPRSRAARPRLTRASGALSAPSLASDYDKAERGAQFLTEVQGSSDVGANEMAAVPDELEPGAWRLRGEKWFCSVADADQFVVTARPVGAPAGTAGLACFLVPRRVRGRPNGFRIRRLKDKLGAPPIRSMSSHAM